MRTYFRPILGGLAAGVALSALTGLAGAAQAQAQERAKRPNIVMLMTDDTGWKDFGAYSGGGAGLGHPTPNIDQIGKEGAVFTNWYGQASCTAGRASFMTGRIPIRSALSIVVAPGDENRLRKETPTIAEFFQKNGYTTYFSGKWHLGDKPDVLSDRARLRRDEDISPPTMPASIPTTTLEVVPSLVPVVQSGIQQDVRRHREPGRVGRRGRPARQDGRHDHLRHDLRRSTNGRPTTPSTTSSSTRTSNKPFFMDVNFIKMHNPTNAAPDFGGKIASR